MAGKGDAPRPVDRHKFAANYDAIDWHRKGRVRKYSTRPLAMEHVGDRYSPKATLGGGRMSSQKSA